MKVLLIIALALAAIALLLWLGLQVKPPSFAPFPGESAKSETVPLPAGLPAPVERFYRTVYGERIPVIKSVVIKGHTEISPFGFPLPGRFVFVHNAGKDYRHYIEATFFGLPIMKVNESYVNGSSRMEIPVGTFVDDPHTTQGALLGLWAESSWFPAIYLTDPRVHWEPVDENTALLYVPFEEKEENFVVRFNPDTGLIDLMEAMRYRDPGPDSKKILWITSTLPGPVIPGTPLSATGAATWLDMGKPWAIFHLEEVKYNVDVSEYLLKRGE